LFRDLLLVIADGTEVEMNARHIRLNRMSFSNLNTLMKTGKLINQPPRTRLGKPVFGLLFLVWEASEAQTNIADMSFKPRHICNLFGHLTDFKHFLV